MGYKLSQGVNMITAKGHLHFHNPTPIIHKYYQGEQDFKLL